MKPVLNLKPIALALVSIGLAISPLAAQGPVNHEVTKIKINEPVLVPGKVLPPGEYEISVMSPSTERDIVQFRNLTTNKVEALVIALPDYRTRPTEKTVLDYWETPKDTPPALRAWFYPDEQWGAEFVYPKAMAKKIEETRQNAPVPQADYGSDAPLTQETAQQVDLSGIPKKRSSAQAKSAVAQAGTTSTSSGPALAKATPSSNDSSQSSTTTPKPPAAQPAKPLPQASSQSSATTVAAKTPNATAKNASTANTKQQSSNTLLAQNQTKGKASPVNAQTQQNRAQDNRAKSANTQMPQTASPVPAIFLTGLGTLCAAFLLRRRRRAV